MNTQNAWRAHKDRQERYSGLAGLYDTFRPGYPDEVFNKLQSLSGLEQGDNVLDIGCGTGQIAFALSALGARVTAIDLEKDMIEVCKKKDTDNTIKWICGRAEELSLSKENYRLVTMGRSFHWMNRPTVLDKLWSYLEEGGICTIIWDEFSPDSNRNEWAFKMKDLAAEFAGPKAEISSENFKRHEDVINESKFFTYKKSSIKHTRAFTVDQVLGHYLSFSWCNKELLGSSYEQFCSKANTLLSSYSDAGQLEEDMVFTILSMEKA